MSRSRSAAAALLVPAAAGGVVLFGAGTASALVPYSGNGYVGVKFDPNETRVLSDVNAGDALDLIPNEFWGVRLADGSIYKVPDEVVRARLDQLIDETADHRGQVSFTINDPTIWGKNLGIIQQWR